MPPVPLPVGNGTPLAVVMVVVTVMLSVTVTVTGGGHSDVLLDVVGEIIEVGGGEGGGSGRICRDGAVRHGVGS